jgi:hypothetical protein
MSKETVIYKITFCGLILSLCRLLVIGQIAIKKADGKMIYFRGRKVSAKTREETFLCQVRLTIYGIFYQPKSV